MAVIIKDIKYQTLRCALQNKEVPKLNIVLYFQTFQFHLSNVMLHDSEIPLKGHFKLNINNFLSNGSRLKDPSRHTLFYLNLTLFIVFDICYRQLTWLNDS
jgi:hypothetical protein